MCDLQRKIQKIEADIQADQNSLRLNTTLLREKIKKPEVIGFLMVSGFAAGYLIGAKFDKNAVKEHMAKVPSRLYQLFEHIKVILPLIPML